MPQGNRTEVEDIDFKRMLVNMDLLYLGCSVLVLLDLSYVSRFCQAIRIEPAARCQPT